MSKHTALEVAKWFLAYNRIMESQDGAELLSNLKLQKLLYYAQGTFLAITGDVLFQDEILAWQHGPVVRSVYDEYKANGSNGILFDEDFDFDSFTPEENRILKEVYNVFGQYSAWKLRNMTHSEAPWKQTELNHEISIEAIRDYFVKEYIE